MWYTWYLAIHLLYDFLKRLVPIYGSVFIIDGNADKRLGDISLLSGALPPFLRGLTVNPNDNTIYNSSIA
jgi:hypothetical protein